ncbi:MAG: hypothetical protein WBV47_09945 [Salegentibacter sp.]
MSRLLGLITFLLFAVACSTDSPSDHSSNLKSVGDSANALLSDEQFTSMNIEIMYVDGYAPSTAAINGFKNFLQERIYKPDGIKISMRAVPSSGKAPFDIHEIGDIEQKNRSVYNAGDEIAIFIYFADGSNEEDDAKEEVVLGSAFRNTSIVVYEKTIENFASKPNAPSKSVLENAVLDHEFGHLFGLVDMGSEPQSDHLDTDPGHKGHCDVPGCLMRASLEFGTGVVDITSDGSVPVLDAQCIADLRANGGK